MTRSVFCLDAQVSLSFHCLWLVSRNKGHLPFEKAELFAMKILRTDWDSQTALKTQMRTVTSSGSRLISMHLLGGRKVVLFSVLLFKTLACNSGELKESFFNLKGLLLTNAANTIIPGKLSFMCER